jgi:hypothetical protein
MSPPLTSLFPIRFCCHRSPLGLPCCQAALGPSTLSHMRTLPSLWPNPVAPCLSVRVVDPFKASYGVDSALFAVSQLAQTTMRSELGRITLDKVGQGVQGLVWRYPTFRAAA